MFEVIALLVGGILGWTLNEEYKPCHERHCRKCLYVECGENKECEDMIRQLKGSRNWKALPKIR